MRRHDECAHLGRGASGGARKEARREVSAAGSHCARGTDQNCYDRPGGDWPSRLGPRDGIGWDRHAPCDRRDWPPLWLAKSPRIIGFSGSARTGVDGLASCPRQFGSLKSNLCAMAMQEYLTYQKYATVHSMDT